MVSLNVAILADDRLFCQALVRLLSEQPGLEIVAYDEGTWPLALRAAHHIVLVDARMSGVLDSCEAWSATGGPSLILVGAPEDDDWACRALAAGAVGILTKASHLDDVVRAIHVVHGGGVWAKQRWLKAWAQDLAASQVPPAPTSTCDSLLSRREREVFHAAAGGAGNKELADRLAISEATVKAHMTRIFHKLGVSGRAELAAAYHGLAGRGAAQSAADRPRTPGRTPRLHTRPSTH